MVEPSPTTRETLDSILSITHTHTQEFYPGIIPKDIDLIYGEIQKTQVHAIVMYYYKAGNHHLNQGLDYTNISCLLTPLINPDIPQAAILWLTCHRLELPAFEFVSVYIWAPRFFSLQTASSVCDTVCQPSWLGMLWVGTVK